MDNTNIENLVEQIVESSDVQIDELNEIDELEHHGIPGMKWGIRRYQNKDGTLTAKGKKRYSAEMEKLKEREQVLKNKQKTQAKMDKLAAKKKELDELETTTKPVVKKLKKVAGKEEPEPMTNAELRAKIERIKLEQELASLSPKKQSFGKKLVEQTLIPAALEAGKGVLKDFISEKASSLLGLNKDDLEDSYKALKKEADIAKLKSTIADSEMKVRKNEQEKADEKNSTTKQQESTDKKTSDNDTVTGEHVSKDKNNSGSRNASSSTTKNTYYYDAADEPMTSTSVIAYEKKGRNIVSGLLGKARDED